MKKPLLFAAISLTAIFLFAGCGASNDLWGSLSSETGKSAAAEASDLGGSLATGEENSTSVNKLPQRSSEPETVYFTSDISAEGLVRIYEALGWTPSGKTAVKISTGEPPASNYLRPELIGDLVQKLDGTIVECNTAYGGSRASSAMHRQVAEDHGFTAIADFDLMDEEGEVEMVSGFRDHVGGEHIIYINVMNRLSVDCDCDGHPDEPDMHDIGILASFDPVALDQACVDLVYQAPDSEALVNRIESRNGIHTLEHAEEIGLGSRTYELVKIDE